MSNKPVNQDYLQIMEVPSQAHVYKLYAMYNLISAILASKHVYVIVELSALPNPPSQGCYRAHSGLGNKTHRTPRELNIVYLPAKQCSSYWKESKLSNIVLLSVSAK